GGPVRVAVGKDLVEQRHSPRAGAGKERLAEERLPGDVEIGLAVREALARDSDERRQTETDVEHRQQPERRPRPGRKARRGGSRHPPACNETDGRSREGNSSSLLRLAGDVYRTGLSTGGRTTRRGALG